MSDYSNSSTLPSVTVNVDNYFPQPTTQSRKELAVVVENACKGYGNGSLILNNFSMTVERGTIYGLLGASGCGKTSILSCIVGLRKLDSGKIHVYGHPPGSKESGIPGRTIGYMPQDIALYNIFTIKEMIQYYGRIYGMTENEIIEKIDFLINFLDLPASDRRIGSLSGGQMRRASLAVSLIHEPELLILDEPTVGVDPLLRESIWKHLSEMVEKKQTTIIITTHYIEEARSFDKIGFMRNGRLIIEAPPQQLLNDHNSDRLEDIILQLCKFDTPNNNDSQTMDWVVHSAPQNGPSTCHIDTQPVSDLNVPSQKSQSSDTVAAISYARKRNPSGLEIEVKPSKRQNIPTSFSQKLLSHVKKVRSITTRNYLALVRTPWFLMVMIFIPTTQIILSNFIFGRIPKFTTMGVVNNEIRTDDLLQFCDQNISTGCLGDNLSCKLLNTFLPEEITWIPYSSEIEAVHSVRKGNTWGYISIPNNYTRYVRERSLAKNFVDNETMDGTEITIRLDESFMLRTDFLKSTLLTRFQEFLKSVVLDCNGEPRSVEIPLKFDAVYGSSTGGERGFFLPGQLILIMFLLPMASSLMHIRDKKAGTLDRTMVAGVQNIHYIIAFLISEGCLIFIQLSICLGALILLFNFEIIGSVCLFMLLLFVQGICGLAIGFCIASFCVHEVEVVLCVISLFTLSSYSSGALWPIESLGKVGQIICYSLPTTAATEAVRSIVDRGWGFSHLRILSAFGIMTAWIVVSGILTQINRRVRNK